MKYVGFRAQLVRSAQRTLSPRFNDMVPCVTITVLLYLGSIVRTLLVFRNQIALAHLGIS